MSLDEVKRTAENANRGKAVGIDKITIEALKHLNCIRILYTFFTILFYEQSDTSGMD